MHIHDLNGKNVCILGFGREGKATVEALEKFAPECEITIADQNQNINVPKKKYWTQLGEGWLQNIEKFNVIIKSPGIPPQPEFNSVQKKITNSTQIFLDTINAPLPGPLPAGRQALPRGEGTLLVIGVTGSKGKSTTASLIAHILRKNGKDVSLIGNIGNPSIAHIDEAHPLKIFVMEMSSYQLMDLKVSPPIAVITSFFPEHLDYHLSLKKYKEAKIPIAKFQTKNDIVFFNAIYDEAKKIASLSPGEHVPFTSDDAPIAIIDTQLMGTHNLSNIAAAWKVAEYLGIPKQKAMAAIQSFTPLPHRLQSIGTSHGIEWVNDSIATNPNATIAAIDALAGRIHTIILGGQDRGFDYSELAKRIADSSIQHIVLLGETTPRIHKALIQAKFIGAISMIKTLKDAVQKVFSVQFSDFKKPIVLLSPAAPSYDQFKNFEERGKAFCDIITRA